MAKEKISTILVPIDGSEASLRTAKFAASFAKQVGASVILLHVVTVPQFPRYFRSLDEYYAKAGKEAESWIDMIRNLREGRGIAIKGEVMVGAISIVESIVEYSERKNVDLIIIGTRGKSKFTKLVLGSVANGVVTHAKCPVLLVK
jgi:nucleotide-binding universal stress UspA family protein